MPRRLLSLILCGLSVGGCALHKRVEESGLAKFDETAAPELDDRNPVTDGEGRTPTANAEGRMPAAWGDCRLLGDRLMKQGDYFVGGDAYFEYVEDNEQAWVRRLQMIESASKRIYVQYYIFNLEE